MSNALAPGVADSPTAALPSSAPAPEPERTYTHFPAHILTFEHQLGAVQRDVETMRRQADGIIGPIGLDGLLTIIPVVGGLYSAYAGFTLLSCAFRARCSASTKISGVVLTVADMGIGVVVGVGDLLDFLFRSHAIQAGMILREIENKQVAIAIARQIGGEQGYLTQSQIDQLEDQLFRGGKTKFASQIGTWIALGALGVLLYSCVA